MIVRGRTRTDYHVDICDASAPVALKKSSVDKCDAYAPVALTNLSVDISAADAIDYDSDEEIVPQGQAQVQRPAYYLSSSSSANAACGAVALASQPHVPLTAQTQQVPLPLQTTDNATSAGY